MRLPIVAAFVTASFSALLSQAFSEEIGSKTRKYLVSYDDESSENYAVIYHGVVNSNKWQTGHASTISHPVDNRQCHWTIETYVEREACLTSRSGEQFCKGQMNRVFGTSFAGKGSDFKLTQLRSENCNDANSRFESDLSNAKAAVNKVLNQVADDDMRQVEADLKSGLKAINVAQK